MERTNVDPSVWTEENYPDDVVEYFKERGAIEFISCLRHGRKRFAELKEQLDISTGILSKRLTEAQGLGLTTVNQVARDGTVYKTHKLTNMGEMASERMEEIGLSQIHQRLWTIRQEFEQYKSEFEEHVSDPEGVKEDVQEYRKYFIDAVNSEEPTGYSDVDYDPHAVGNPDLDPELAAELADEDHPESVSESDSESDSE